MYGPIFFVSILGAFREIAAASQHINKDLTNHYNARFHVYEEPYSIDFTYHNYEQMSRFLRTTSLRFQNLTALYSIGKSVKGMLPRKHFLVLFTTILILIQIFTYCDFKAITLNISCIIDFFDIRHRLERYEYRCA